MILHTSGIIIKHNHTAEQITYQCPVGAMKYKQQWIRLSGNGVRWTLDSALRYSSNLLSMNSIIGIQLEKRKNKDFNTFNAYIKNNNQRYRSLWGHIRRYRPGSELFHKHLKTWCIVLVSLASTWTPSIRHSTWLRQQTRLKFGWTDCLATHVSLFKLNTTFVKTMWTSPLEITHLGTFIGGSHLYISLDGSGFRRFLVQSNWPLARLVFWTTNIST